MNKKIKNKNHDNLNLYKNNNLSAYNNEQQFYFKKHL